MPAFTQPPRTRAGIPLVCGYQRPLPGPAIRAPWPRALSLYSRTCCSTALLETVTLSPISPNPPFIPVLERATQLWPQDWIFTRVV